MSKFSTDSIFFKKMHNEPPSITSKTTTTSTDIFSDFCLFNNKETNVAPLLPPNKAIVIQDDEEEEIVIEDSDSSEDDSINFDDHRPSIHFQLFSVNSISIEFEPVSYSNEEYEKILIQNGAYFDANLKIWIAPYKSYQLLLVKSNEFSKKFQIKGIPKIAIKALQEASFTSLSFTVDGKDVKLDYTSDITKKKSVDQLPSYFRKKLYSFQVDGIKFGIERHGRVLIADEMGVGKTIQSIGLCKIYEEDWPVLIICPGSVKYSWQNEIKMWLKLKSNHIQIINGGKEKFIKDIKFYIVSYDLVRRISKRIEKQNFQFVILDESHCIKSIDAQRTLYIMPIAQRAKRLLLLSGTPLLSRPIEGFTALSCLRPDIFNNFKSYGKRYCGPVLTHFGINWSGASNTKELHLIFNTIMLRRLKKDVLSQLPSKRRMKIEIECEQSALMEIKGYYDNKKRKDCPKLTMPDVYRLTGEAKIKGIKMYLNDILENDIKFLVFAHHQFVLNEIEALIKKKKVGYIRIDGSTVGEERFQKVNHFQSHPECRVAILSINAASTGITLTQASLVIFAELTWTPAIMIQAEDRAHRIGQQSNCVDVSYLYGRDTIDEYIFSKLDQKLNIVSTTLDDIQSDLELKNKEKTEKKKKKKENIDTNEDDDSVEDINAVNKDEKSETSSITTEMSESLDINHHEPILKEKRIMNGMNIIEENSEYEDKKAPKLI